MKLTKNNLFLYTLVSFFVFTLSIVQAKAADYVNYYGIAMSNQEYNNLLELGFSEDEIYHMNEETFETNKNIESSLVVEDERYYKTVYTNLNGDAYSVEITKNEYDNQSSMNTRGTVETSYKTMVTTMSQGSDSFRYKVTLAWKQMPKVRSYDIIGIGFSNDLYISSSVYFNYYYCDENDDCTTSTMYYDRKKLSTGGSIVYKVPSSDIKSLTAVLYYDVKKNTSSTITELNMCGDYSHATTALGSTDYTTYSVNINGIQFFSGLSSYYDAIPCALSTWYGSW